jgi:hypothetical protein
MAATRMAVGGMVAGMASSYGPGHGWGLELKKTAAFRPAVRGISGKPPDLCRSGPWPRQFAGVAGSYKPGMEEGSVVINPIVSRTTFGLKPKQLNPFFCRSGLWPR